MYIHSTKCYKCQIYAKVFTFKSTYQVHRRTHLTAKLYKCFVGGCDREYKWAQDLHHHVQCHLQLVYGCNICNYTSHEKQRVRRCRIKHEDVILYKCDSCDFGCKYYTQWSRHSAKCGTKK